MQKPQNFEKRRAVRYLPRTLINYWADHPDTPPVFGEWLTGSLMHCDVTGFTAMSETLAKSGKEGAEIMAGILNLFFERMLGIANEWNGIQMKFGGDAMLLYFTGDNHAECAAACGLQMQDAMEEFSEINVNNDICKLRMRIGIHSGEFYAVSGGQENNLLHYLLIGKEVNKAADVEPMAEPDQVVISEETRALLSTDCVMEETKHPGIWWIKQSGKPCITSQEFNPEKIPKGVLRRYLMPPIADGMTAGLLGEHRRVSVVFINLFGLSELLELQGDKTALLQANQYLNILYENLVKYSGYLITSDVCEHGDKILLAFGAPVSVDNQEENAMRFALELQEQLNYSGLGLQQSIGVNSGYVFTGEIGSSQRREYTTIGDTVNLAARLMSAAENGKILVSEFTASRTGNTFELTHLEPIRVKGKSQPIDICLLDGVKQQDVQLVTDNDQLNLVGRNDELEKLESVASIVKQGNCKWAYVYGEPGIGKSHLCSTIASRLKEQGWFAMLGLCQSYNLHNAFSVWIYPLRKLFSIKATDTSDSAWKKITKLINDKLPELLDFAPLVADILSVPFESNAVINSLDAKSKREKRINLITQLLIHVSKEKPIFLLFDNSQWIDSSSAEMLHFVLSQATNSTIYIALISRADSPPGSLMEFTPDLVLHLKELTNKAARELASTYPDLSEDDINVIIGKAKGNPLFLKDLSSSFSENQETLPESIFDAIMVRLDKISDDKKSLLRNATVIGQVFDLATLDSLVFNKQRPVDEER